MVTGHPSQREVSCSGKHPSVERGRLFAVIFLSCLIFSCARMGSPDGGWYDDTPPRVVSSSPAENGISVTQKKIVIDFNEYIKVENAQEKVIISPPQLEQADIRTQGKRIVVELKDSLKENTTYTVDFSDAITDNNEGNPMGSYTFSFSTGGYIDTLEVSGYVLNAEDLEPVKGILVGLYPYDSPDSIFHKEAMMRVSRTNGSGRFSIKGVAPGSYRAFALNDADGDFVYGQKSELVAFSHDSIVPSWKPDTRQDTIWRDTLHIDNIVRVPYTHFLPDNITLLCFQAPQTDRFLVKTERTQPEKIGLFFSHGHEDLPLVKGLDFDSDSAFVIEPSAMSDTIYYWLRDTTLINRDTLTMALQFWATDTLGALVMTPDTITALSKVPFEKRQKEKQKEYDKWKKEQDKLKKRGERYDSIMPKKFLELKFNPSGQMTPLENIRMEVAVPLARCDTSMVHLYSKVDSIWYRSPHEFRQVSTRQYLLTAAWQPDMEYSLEIDSAAFENIYGLVNNKLKQGIKVSGPDKFSTLALNISGAPIAKTDTAAVIVARLLDSSGKIVSIRNADATGHVKFDYVKPGKYYLSAYCDMNGNGKWDTGSYDDDLQPEPVYYFDEEVECKEKWDVSRQWNLTAKPWFEQKPAKITKQKPDQAKKLRNRNIDRAKQLGKEYIKGVGL